MPDLPPDPHHAQLQAYLHLPQDLALARFPALSQVYALEAQLAVDARAAGAASDDVVAHVLGVLRGTLAKQLEQGETVRCDAAMLADLRWQVAFRNLHVAVTARIENPRLRPALSAEQRDLLIEHANALRAHDLNRPDDVNDGVDTFRATEVALSLALLDYPDNLVPFTDAALRAAYERHQARVVPRHFGKPA